MSTRDALARARPRIQRLSLTDDTEVHVRALSGAGRQAYLDLVEAAGEGRTPSIATIVALGLCEADGSITYDHRNPADLLELDAVDGATLNLIASTLFEISGLTTDAVDQAEKKSDASRSV